jgi:predicted HicB family RNase H-like nuclease
MDLKIFIAITTAAVVIQAGILVSILFAFRKTANTIHILSEDFRKQIPPTAQLVRSIAGDFRPKLETITANVSEVRALVRSRVERFDGDINGTANRIRFQVSRGAGLVTKTTERFEDVSENIRRTVVLPIRRFSTLFRVLTIARRVLKGNKRRD